MIDRQLQRHYSYTGIKGNNAQDAAILEGQGPTPIYDRTKEFLVVGDIGIAEARKRLLKVAKELQEGTEPVATMNDDFYNMRPVAVFIDDNGTQFYEQDEVKKYIFV